MRYGNSTEAAKLEHNQYIRLADQEFIELFDMKTLWLAMGQAEQQDDGVIRPAWSKRLLLLS
jgi:hypothetical protein